MFCGNCGSKIDNGAIFCPKCGYQNQIAGVRVSEFPGSSDSTTSPRKSYAATTPSKPRITSAGFAAIALSVLTVAVALVIYANHKSIMLEMTSADPAVSSGTIIAPNPFYGKYGVLSDGVYQSELLGFKVVPNKVVRHVYVIDSRGLEYTDDFWYDAIIDGENCGSMSISDEWVFLENWSPGDSETPEGIPLESITLGNGVFWRTPVQEGGDGYSHVEIYGMAGDQRVVICILANDRVDEVIDSFLSAFVAP